MAFSDYEQKTDDLRLANSAYFAKINQLIKLLFLRTNTHITSKGNVHGLTKNDIGLGDVANYAPANDPTAAAGESKNTLVTPYQLAKYIEMNVHQPLTSVFLSASNAL